MLEPRGPLAGQLCLCHIAPGHQLRFCPVDLEGTVGHALISQVLDLWACELREATFPDLAHCLSCSTPREITSLFFLVLK